MKKFHIGSLVLGVALLIVLIWQIGPEALRRDLLLLGWGMVPFVLIEGVAFVLHTVAWRYCLADAHRSLPFLRLLGINLAGTSISYFTPTATLGGEVIKGTLLSSSQPGPEAATGVLIGKVAFALSHLLFVIAGSILIIWKIDLPAAGAVTLLAGSAVLGSGIFGFLIVQKKGQLGAVVRWLVAHRVGGRPLQKAALQITLVDEALLLFYRERPLDFFLSMFWHTTANFCSIVRSWIFFLWVAEGSFLAAAGIWFLGTWFDMLTFAVPLGIGVQEGFRVVAFKALGFTLDLGLTYGIAVRLEQIFWGIVGLAVYPALLSRRSKENACGEKRAAGDCAPLDS
jgi:hypothetical protein